MLYIQLCICKKKKKIQSIFDLFSYVLRIYYTHNDVQCTMKSNTITQYYLCTKSFILYVPYEYIGVPILYIYRVVNNNFVAVGFCCMHNKQSKWKAYGCRFIVFHSIIIMLSIVFVWTVATECYIVVVVVNAAVAATSVAILFVCH